MSASQKVSKISFTASNWRGFWWLWSIDPPCGMELKD
jgi:hypothetical protein